MRKPVVVISLFLLLFQIGVVTGCRGTRVPDDARLVAADSLLASDPDSALALVEALAPDSLSTEGDRRLTACPRRATAPTATCC